VFFPLTLLYFSVLEYRPDYKKEKKKQKLLSSNFVNLVKKTLNNTNDWTFFPLEFQAKLIELQ